MTVPKIKTDRLATESESEQAPLHFADLMIQKLILKVTLIYC